MRKNSTLALLALGCVVSIAVKSVQAQEMHYLVSRVNDRLDVQRTQVRAYLVQLADYPKDVRDAWLEAAENPRLLFQSDSAPAMPQTQIGGLSAPAAAQPTTQSNAMRVLASQPGLVARMQQDVATVALIGQTYAGQKDVFRGLLDRMSAEQAARSTATIDAWVKRISRDTTSMVQLDHVRTQLRGGGLAPPVGVAPSPTLPALAKTAVPARALPSIEEIRFALQNCDRFPELAGLLVDQWENEQNPEWYRREIDSWYGRFRDVLPDSFSGDPAFRASIFKEVAALDRKYNATNGGLVAGRVNMKQYLDEHATEFPSLVRVQDDKIFARIAAKPVRVAGGPYTTSGSGSGAGSSSSSSRSSGSSGMSRGSTSTARSGSSSSGSNGFGSGSSGFGNGSSGFGGGGSSGFGGGGSSGFGGGGSSGFGGGSSGFGGGSSGGSSSGFGSSGFGGRAQSSFGNNQQR